jgi:hypothetical protein
MLLYEIPQGGRDDAVQYLRLVIFVWIDIRPSNKMQCNTVGPP